MIRHPRGMSDRQKASTFTITYEPTTHCENIRHSLLDAPFTGKYGDEEVVLKTVTMFSTHVAKQQTTVPKTKNNLAKVAVLLQHDFAFLTLNIYPTTQNTILSKYSEKHWDPYDKRGISVCFHKG